MSENLGLTEEAYRSLEKGRTIRLEWDTILRLMDVLDAGGLSVDWFFGRSPKLAAPAPAPPRPDTDSSGESERPGRKPRQALERAASAVLSEEAARPPLPNPVYKVPRPRRRRGFRAAGADVPLLDLDQISPALRATGSVVPPGHVPRIRVSPPAGRDVIAVRVRGRISITAYQDGDVVLCSRGRPEPGSPGLLILKGPECLLAVWRTEASGRLRVNPLDADLPVLSVSPDDVSAEFAVVRRLAGDEASAHAASPTAAPQG